MPKKSFTREEADALLPLIQEELKNMQTLKQDFDQKYRHREKLKMSLQRQRQGGPQETRDHNTMFRLEARLDFIEIEMRTHIYNIHRNGAILKSMDIGLVDFPAVIDGEEVLLCWKWGESRVQYYHTTEEGFANRKKIEDEEKEL